MSNNVSATPIRVVIADDHAIFLEGLAALLRLDQSVHLAAAAADGTELVELLEQHRPDLAVVDLSMPGLRPEDLPAELEARGVVARLVALTMHREPGMVRRVLRVGFAGYVLKDDAFAELIAAIRTVAAGATYLSRSLGDAVAAGPDPAELSDREREVLRGIAVGHTTKRLAGDLGVSPRTVETYRSRIMRKLNVRSSAEMIRVAIELGLLR